ncbi:MAG TPA: recombinase family protein [Candidatus Saccharimonadia bacterium]|nr:recombinase family protein [Candidatus Saccharimonadia bacterium]
MKKAVIYLRVSTAGQARKGLDLEGYSIPAQREECRKKAAELGAEVVQEFVDSGESAKYADRKAIQAMIAFVKEANDVDYAIFHKIDRFARNTQDYENMKFELRKAGTRLASVTENIDDSASGKLMERMLANMAEYYVDNLSYEVIKGATVKARLGRTPYKAPLGYVNSRQIVEGHEVKTVVLDPERADLVRFAFKAYATGQYSLVRLVDILDAKGLTARPHVSSPARSLGVSGLNVLLRNGYYCGQLKYRGITYDGRQTLSCLQSCSSASRTCSKQNWLATGRANTIITSEVRYIVAVVAFDCASPMGRHIRTIFVLVRRRNTRVVICHIYRLLRLNRSLSGNTAGCICLRMKR